MVPLEDKAAHLSRDEIVALLVSQQELTTRVEELQRQLEWFKRQLFGSKSERRLLAPDGRQLFLGEPLAQEPHSGAADRDGARLRPAPEPGCR